MRNALFSGTLARIITAKYLRGEIPSLEPYQSLMQNKIIRLNREYNFRSKICKDDDSYLGKFGMTISIACFTNKLFPNFFEGLF